MTSIDTLDHSLSEVHGDQVRRHQDLWTLFLNAVKKNPGGTAIICPHQAVDHLSFLFQNHAPLVDCLSWTFTELQHAAQCLADYLQRLGLRKGSIIVAFMNNSVEWAILFWAASKIKATFAPLDPRLVTRRDELRHILQLLEPSAIIAQDSSLAKAITTHTSDMLHSVKAKLVCDTMVSELQEIWRDLEVGLREGCGRTLNASLEDDLATGDDPALLIFTTGTTALPKGCVHTAESLWSQSEVYVQRQIHETDKQMVQGPTFHSMAIFYTLTAWRSGAAVVFPSMKFDPTALLKCMARGIQYMGCSPGMLDAIFAHSLFNPSLFGSVKMLSLGADVISPALREKCQAMLPVKLCRVVWGMSESIGAIYFDLNEEQSVKDGVYGIGRVQQGGMARICEFGKRSPIKRSEIGELHIGGTSVINKYFKGNTSAESSFYSDKYGCWLCTGDRAFMDETGIIYTKGRYKDTIIRGGENISPGQIEACLNNHTENIKAEVIGVDDETVGQVPVAVIQRLSHAPKDDVALLKSALRRSVISQLGPEFSLSDVIMLEDLGLQDFPRTSVGKVRKVELRDHVNKFLATQVSQSFVDHNVTLQKITQLWSDILGLPQSEIGPSVSVLDYTDSLTIMRFCHKVELILGKKLSTKEVLENETTEKQFSYIKTLEDIQIKEYSAVSRSGSPQVQDIVVAEGDPRNLESIIQSVTPSLDKLDMSWDRDVEDVYQNTAFITQFMSLAADWNLHILHTIRDHSTTVSELRDAIEKVLTLHPPMRTVISTWKDEYLHLVLRSNQNVFNICIEEDLRQVSTPEDLYRLMMNTQEGSNEFINPAYKAKIFHIESTGGLALVHTMHHSVFDASSWLGFMEDLDAILNKLRITTPPMRVPLKSFADMYHSNKSNSQAEASVEFQVQRLKALDLETLRKCVWPMPNEPSRPRSKETTQNPKGMRSGSLYGFSYFGFSMLEQKYEGPVVQRAQKIPALKAFKAMSSVEISTLVKLAVAIFDTEMTGQCHAVFSSADSGRRWPFISSQEATELPNPMSIAGPTLGINLDIIHVNGTTLQLLQRVEKDEIEATGHSHAVLSDVTARLGTNGGLILSSFMRHQHFNWDPIIRSRKRAELSTLKGLGVLGAVRLGILWRFGMLDAETLQGTGTHNRHCLSRDEADLALARVLEICVWLADKENWGQDIRCLPSNPAVKSSNFREVHVA